MYVGRLAPSPTGLLHLGHARTFWTAFERARNANGTLWLRNEDLDAQRSREEFAVAMREDLHWLGIPWQHEMQQSTRIDEYRAALDKLATQGLVYACSCSRKDLAAAVQAPHEDIDDEPVYSGCCLPASIETVEIQAGMNYRLRITTNEPVRFDDANAGPQTFTPGTDFGDFLVWRKDGLPSYQLACVVDDAATNVTEVVRGRDLLKSTARQILLQHALGIITPQYFHCDLMRDDAGVRLAKRHDALSLRTLREQGYTPEQVRAMF